MREERADDADGHANRGGHGHGHGTHASQGSHASLHASDARNAGSGHAAHPAREGAAAQAPAEGSASAPAPHRKYHDPEQVYHRILAAYHERYPVNEKLRKAVHGKTRKVLVRITDGKDAGFVIENDKLHRVEPRGLGKPDITLETSTADLLALFNRELSPVEAYFKKRVKVHASMSDLLLARSFLG
jgi:putative sterol carrier protein